MCTFNDLNEEVNVLINKQNIIKDIVEYKEKREKEKEIFTPKTIKNLLKEFNNNDIKYNNFVKVYFGKKEFFDLFCKHFRVNGTDEPNISNTNLLNLVLILIEKDIIKVNKLTNESCEVTINEQEYTFNLELFQ